MSQSLAISAASTRFGVGIKRGVRPSNRRTSLELSSASFECSTSSTKCTVLLVHLSSSCFKVILRRRRLTSVSTGRVFHSSYVILEALFTPCPGRDPDRGRFRFCHSEVRSSSSVRDPLFPPDAIPEFERLHVRRRRLRGILLTCGAGFPIEEGSVGCPIQPSSLMALLHHVRLPVHRLFCSSSGFCSSCFLLEHPRSRFLETSKSALSLPGLLLVYYYYAAFLPVLQRDFRDLCILRVQIDICSSGPSSFLALRAAV